MQHSIGMNLGMNDILLPSQFGFRTRQSCELQLLIVIDDFSRP